MTSPFPPMRKTDSGLSSRTTRETMTGTNTEMKTTTKTSADEPPRIFKCTFPNCKFSFRTDQEMKKHKSTYLDHEYCPKCDLDCESEEQILLHKIKSKKHIVCPICGIDFGSEGGRDRHIRQFHRTSQNLTCHGCQDTFRSAAGLMRHIEDGECVAISSDRLLFEQSKKLMRKEALEIPAAPLPIAPSIFDADGEGGVAIPMTLGERNREAMANQPTNKDDGIQDLIDEHWPKLGINDSSFGNGLGDLMAFTDVSVTENPKPKEKDKNKENENVGWHDKGREHVAVSAITVGSGSASTSRAGTDIAAPSGGAGALSIGPPDAGLVLEKIYRDWDPANFLDEFSGEYVCACGKRCLTKEGFEKHVLSKSQGSRQMQCPGCLKIFRSTAALIAHCESASMRCDVNETNLYAKIIDEVSGGMIQTSGYNEDGTIRYVAGEVDLRKVTVGVDLDMVGW
ncbi:putative C2H2 finger domain protein [Aspergillus undulatus]|uniref:putative C2H2 finger domain protein n=1 Tax=Aspergillus undulatus TaxID=1810928 RepID=UPI003CCE23FB